jgi:N-acetylglutamate synthase-like GNAT family acetyltransferase
MIRKANKFDLLECVEMMRRFAAESPVQALRDPLVHDEKHIQQIFITLIMGRGVVLVDDDMRGMIVGAITPNFWCPKIREIKELAWYVYPEHRNKMIGGRLLMAFEKEAQDLIDQGRANFMAMSLMSADINLTRRGFQQLEKTYVKG